VEHFGSLRAVEQAGLDALTAVVPRKLAEIIHAHFRAQDAAMGVPAGTAPVVPTETIELSDGTFVAISSLTDPST
jgi:hypothetical protein